MEAVLQSIYVRMLEEYGCQGWWPLSGKYHPGRFEYPRTENQLFEICIGAILTQNTAWKNVELALKNLREADLLTPQKIIAANTITLAQLIRPAGYFNQKAKKLKMFAPHFVKWQKKAPTRDELLEIWGIGKETADSILLYAFHEPIFVIDAYTKRLFARLGITRHDATYDQLQALFMDRLDRRHELFNEYHALIVEHAKQHCSAKPRCPGCPLRTFCHSAV
jgi:endonuclease III related protein